MADDRLKNDEYWREKLSPEEYRICREKGTERAFTGEYYDKKDQGLYKCKCCGTPLFDAETKYDSGSGWPSFTAAIADGTVGEHRDKSLMMERVEVVCSQCESHLGHVFPDGPGPTGMRYCVNSAALNFSPKGENDK